jgi:DNA-binding transcriptional MerR regulator
VRIGEVVTRSGVSDKTLRFYEEVGVLDRPKRAPSGYRDYDADALDRLAFVRAAQAVGLTLGEIREVIAMRDRGEVPCAHVLDLLQQRSAEVEARIAELHRLQAELRRLARRARTLDAADCDPGRVCHLIAPSRRKER